MSGSGSFPTHPSRPMKKDEKRKFSMFPFRFEVALSIIAETFALAYAFDQKSLKKWKFPRMLR